MGSEFVSWIKDAYATVLRCSTLHEAHRLLLRRSEAIASLTDRERYVLVEAMMEVARKVRGKSGRDAEIAGSRRQVFDGVVKSCNQVEEHRRERLVRDRAASQMENGRKQADPTVFWLSSWHQDPAEDHRDWQGKLYVDRYWRSALSSSGSRWRIPMVEALLRNKQIPTVQWVMGGPVWLMTRPHCRHYLIPIGTSEALSSSNAGLKKAHREGLMPVHRPLSDAERYRRKEVLRRSVGRQVREYAKASR